MEEKVHLETLRRIRRITADGLLESREVHDLAEYLERHREARAAWPGSILWPTLESIFEDGVLTDEELAVMGDILVGILAECATKPNLALTSYIRTQSKMEQRSQE
ncbi:MAG: hypothetical protein ISQ14_03590 [Verrucomicrobiae bacterium]|jgi:hypothetical protein|nr:hypothetical protein [Verrucomicrobiae bacterium]